MNNFGVAIVTGSFTLLGIGMTLWFNNRRIIIEHRRWYAEHFLGQKLQSIRGLHGALEACFQTMNYYGNCPPVTLVEFKEEIAPKKEAYLQKMAMASIYFSDEEQKVFSRALGAFSQASLSIWLSLPEDLLLAVKKASYPDGIKNFDWVRFFDSYEKAKTLLKDKLAPEILGRMENPKGLH